MKLSDELKHIDEELDGLRFAGIDQNPKGIRDRLYSLIADAKKLEQKTEIE